MDRFEQVSHLILNFSNSFIKAALENLYGLLYVGLDTFVIVFITSTFLVLQLRNCLAQTVDLASKFCFLTFFFLVEADDFFLKILWTVC